MSNQSREHQSKPKNEGLFAKQNSWLLRELGQAYEKAQRNEARSVSMEAARSIHHRFGQESRFRKELQTLRTTPPTFSETEDPIFRELIGHLEKRIIFGVILQTLNGDYNRLWLEQAVILRGCEKQYGLASAAWEWHERLQENEKNPLLPSDARSVADRQEALRFAKNKKFQRIDQLARHLEFEDLPKHLR